MVLLPNDAGLSATAETLVGILKRVVVTFLKSPSSRGLSVIDELLVELRVFIGHF